jgi:hypothetical protein
MEQRKKRTGLIAGVLVLILAIGAMTILYNQFMEKGTPGAKKVVVEVIQEDDSSKSYEIQTDAEYLRQALEEKKLIEGTEGDFGLYVTTVDGRTVDEGKQEWWCLTQDGNMLNTSVDTTPLKDGDHFELTLTVGW